MLHHRSLLRKRAHGFFTQNAVLSRRSPFLYRYICIQSAQTPSVLTASSSHTFRHGPSFLSTTRLFSSASIRGKEKSTRSRDETEERNEGGSEDKQVEPGREKDVTAEAKGKSPEPIPPADGRGSSAGADNTGGIGDSGGGGSGKKRKASQERSLSKPMVPEVYPQVMAIPIAKRPLFPGFYKAITIRNPDVTQAIYEAVKRGQPYIGAFLLRDENADKDIIESMDDVYEVGTFCQVTSAFPVQGDEPSMTAVLYPHRRIRMTSLVPPGRGEEGSTAQAEVVVEEATEDKPSKEDQTSSVEEKKGDVVASFEET